MKYYFVCKEFECKNCKNKYVLPVGFLKNKLREYKHGPTRCGCGEKDFKKPRYVFSKNKLDVPRGKPLMIKGKTNLGGVLLEFELSECKNCKKKSLIPIVWESTGPKAVPFVCKCGKTDFKPVIEILIKNTKSKESRQENNTYFNFGINNIQEANCSQLKKGRELCSKFINLVEACGKLKEKQTIFRKQFASAVKTKNYLKAAEILPKQVRSTLNLLKKEQEFCEFMLKYFVSKKKKAKLIKKDAKKIKQQGYKALVY